MAYDKARVIRNPASFKIGATEYAPQVDKVRFVADTPVQSKPTMGGVDQDRGTTTYSMEISGHSYRGTGGLVKAFDDAIAAGTNLTATFQPRVGDGEDEGTVTFIPLPTEFGGTVNDWLGFDATFPIVDEPSYDQQSAG